MIPKLKAAWFWAKMHTVSILGGLVAILLAIITLGAYQRRIGRLKDVVEVEKAHADIAALEAKRDAAIAIEGGMADKDAQLAVKDVDLDSKIAKAKRDAVAVREVVKGKTDEEIAARFNQLYRR